VTVVVSETAAAGEVTDGWQSSVGNEALSIKQRASSSSSHAPESRDSFRRCPDEDSGAVVSRIVSTWTSGVVGPLHVNDAALDGVALVSHAVTNASCGEVNGVKDSWLSVSTCDRES